MRSALALVLLTLLATFAPAAEPEYDLVIRNGRVVDGTGNPWFYGDVAITGDKIVAVGRVPDGKAKRDHRREGAWSSRPASSTCTRTPTTCSLEDGHAQSKIRQGVTTEVLGEGRSAGPLKGQAIRRASSRRAARSSPGTRSAATSTPSTRPASASTSPATSAWTTSGNA